MEYVIRELLPGDCAEALALWQNTPGIGQTEADSPAALADYLRRNPGSSCVARHEGRLVGAVLGGHDGRRGYVYHLAVAEPHRGRGVGRALVDACLEKLAASGIRKCSAFLFADNETGRAFWRQLEWNPRGDLHVLQKVIEPRAPSTIKTGPIDVGVYNRDAWDRQVQQKNRWTLPVSDALIQRARVGEWHVVLTPSRPVPRDWFPDPAGLEVLCLASGGGQQAPVLAAAGARVTVLDNSPMQLEQDRAVAGRHSLELTTVQGDMRDLSVFTDESFDLVFHPVSNCFVPQVGPVWREACRVLRPGGVLLAGFNNPVRYIFDEAACEMGELRVRHRVPYSDLVDLEDEELRALRIDRGEPLDFGHTLEDQIGGQLEAGFVLTGFYEDRYAGEDADRLSDHIASFIATRAVKQRCVAKPAEAG